MKKIIIRALAISVCSISTAMAATTTYQTREIDQGVNNTDYRASWGAQTSAITTESLADFNGTVIPGVGAGGGFSHLEIDFSTLSASSNWGFRLAPDAGFGGAIYLDGTLLTSSTDDLWWGGDWNAGGELLTSTGLSLATGNHTFEGYWAEGCCNGGQGVQYTLDGRNWETMSNLPDPIATPIPAAAWLFGSAIAGLVGVSRRKTALA